MTVKQCLSAAVATALMSGLWPAQARADEPAPAGSTSLRASIRSRRRPRIERPDSAGHPAVTWQGTRREAGQQRWRRRSYCAHPGAGWNGRRPRRHVLSRQGIAEADERSDRAGAAALAQCWSPARHLRCLEIPLDELANCMRERSRDLGTADDVRAMATRQNDRLGGES